MSYNEKKVLQYKCIYFGKMIETNKDLI